MTENRVKITISADGKNAEQAIGRLNKNLKATEGQTAKTGKGMRELKSSMSGAVAAIGALAGAAGMGMIISSSVRTAASFETLRVSLKTVTGSSAAAEEALAWITEFTAKTPYQLESVADGFRKLTAYGLDATKYMGTLGDTASAMGKSLDSAVEMFADAAQGEFERLKEFGVRAAVEGDNVTFKWMENGKQMQATTEKTQTAITQTLDGVFAHFKGGMEEQSKTWTGMMSNLSDTTTLFQKKVMDSGPFVVMKSSLAEFMSYLGTVEGQMTLDQWAEDTGHAIVNTMEAATWAVEPLAFAINGLGGSFDALKLGVAEAEEFLLDLYTSIPTWMLPEAMEMSATTIDALRKTIHQTKEEATKDIIETGNTIEGLHGKFENLRQMIDTAGAAGVESIQAVGECAEDTGKDIVKAHADTSKKLSKEDEKRFKEEEKLLKKELKENEDMLKKLGKAEDKAHNQAVDAAVKEFEKKQDLLEDFEDVYDRSLGDQYQMDRDMVRAQAKLYEDAGADKVKVAEWAENEIEKINADELRAHQEAERKKALASDDFFAGMKVGYDDNLKYARTWAMTGYDIMRDFAQESGDVMSDVLFDAVKGDMASLGDYWESFWDSMLRSMTDYVGQMAAEWATAELINLGASFASAIFHSGSTGLKQDELLATLQEGEIVIPAKQSEAIREAIGTGGKSSEGFFNDVVGAVHAGTVHDFSPDSWGRPDIAGMAVGNLLSAGLAGAAAGYSNYGQTMNMGAALQSAGYEISTSAIRDVAMDQALAGAISTAITGFAGGFIGDLGNYALGVSDYNIGTQLGDLNIGAIVNAGLSVLSGLGLPGAMCAALSPLTNLAMSGIADVMGLRANETLRDNLENKYGEIAGRRAYNAVSERLGTVGAEINELGTLSMSEFGTHSLTDIVGSVPFGYSQYGPGEISINLGSGLISNSDGKVAVGDYGSFVDVGMGSMTDSVLGDLSDFTAGLDSEFGPSVSSINDLMASLDAIGAAELAAQTAAAKQAAYDSWQGSAYSISHHGEAQGTGSGRSDGTTGGSMGAGIGAGNSPGSGSEDGHRWTGGPVYSGHQYEINERGQELFMPGQDGRILNAQETTEMVRALTQVANMGMDQSPEVTLLTRLSGYLYGWRSRWIDWSGDLEHLIESEAEGVDDVLSEILASATTINGSVLASTDRLSGDIDAAASSISSSMSSAMSSLRSSIAAASRPAPSSGGSSAGSGTGSATGGAVSSSALRDAAEVFYKSATGGVATTAYNAAMDSIGASSHSEFSRMVGYTGDPSDLASRYGFRAAGGPVNAGHLYEINELGSEMFLPGQDGRILNAQETRDMLASLKSIAKGGNADMSRALFTIATYCQRSATILEKWDINGQPAVEA